MKKLVQFLMLLTLGSFAVSCNDDDKIDYDKATTFIYHKIVPNEDGITFVVLDSLTANVSAIDDAPDWCTVKQSGSVSEESTNPVLELSHQEGMPNQQRTAATVHIKMEDGNKVELVLSQTVLLTEDENGEDVNADFLTDWENQEYVTILSDLRGSAPVAKEVATPWSDITLSTLPTEINEDVKKEDGWSLVFSTLNKRGVPNANYFGLYNKFTGILRVFFFVEDASTGASDVLFEVLMGSTDPKDVHTPFHHALQYGIPTGTKVEAEVGTINVGGSLTKPFSMICTPYSSSNSSALKVGWTAFDIDMTAYNSQDYTKDPKTPAFAFNPYAYSNASIVLNGDLKANITGEYDEPYTTTTTGSVGTVVNTIRNGGQVMKGLVNVAKNVEKMQKSRNNGNKDKDKKASKEESRVAVSSVLSVISAAIDIGCTIYDKYFSDAKKEYTRGKIDMNLTGTISLSGNMTQNQSTYIPAVQMRKNTLLLKDSHFGEGIWGIEQAPIVYVVTDHCLGYARRGINLTVNGDDSYYLGDDPKSYQLRMITFLDPTSIKLNINTSIYDKAIDLVDIDACYGVYPHQNAGHTEAFRQMIGTTKVEKLEVVDSKKFKKGDIAYSNKGNWQMNLCIAEQKTFKSNYFGGDDQQLVETTNAQGLKQYFYGYVDGNGDMSFMPDPQVYFPLSDSGQNVYNPIIPDFVVPITVSFKKDDTTYIFSRRYIPQIVPISGAELEAKYNQLLDLVEKCNEGEAYTTLNNQSSITVSYMSSPEMLEKTLQILKTVLEK